MNEATLIAPLRMDAQPCPYLPGHTACYEHFLLIEGDDEAVCRLIESGFRHFGHYYFRPACAGAPGSAWCGACVPLRVNVAAFAPSKSQRRVLRRAAEVTMEIAAPEFTPEKFEIYLKHRRRFPDTAPGAHENLESFRDSFYCAGPCVRECIYRLEGKIVAVSYMDVTRHAISSIYCTFDPAYQKLAPGTLSILREIEFARTMNVPYYYLGYWIHANRSLKYKAEFRPCEILNGSEWIELRDANGGMKFDPAEVRTARFRPLVNAARSEPDLVPDVDND